jgi:CRP/FNR family cyclic AMP-dependent transcriptional regulator
MSPPRPPARELLAQVSIFAGLDERGLSALERSLKLREYAPEAVIVSHEEHGDSLFILASGRVKVVLYGESGREMILSTFRQPGEFFGEMSLLDDEPRSANVLAVEPSALYVLDRSGFTRCVQENPGVALAVLGELSRRLRRADEIIGNLALLDVHGRVAHLIRELARSEGQETEEGIVIRQRPSQSELAAMVGTSRETVSRALSEFQRRGVLEMEGRRILVRRSFLDEP